MMYCPYCGQRATVEIPSTPGNVCLTHAIEFWTGLLAYTKNRSAEFRTPEPSCAAVLGHTVSARSSAEAAARAEKHLDNRDGRLHSGSPPEFCRSSSVIPDREFQVPGAFIPGGARE
jgi:hypothetical protein